MATTAQEVINRAIQRSALNNPDLIPTAQMLGYVTSFERSAYAQAARYNPDFFGEVGQTGARTAYTDPWDVTSSPGGVFAISALKVNTITGSVTGVAVGDTVNIVGYRWPELQVAPRAYIRGQSIYGYGTELGSSDSNMVTKLDVFFSQLPAAITAVGTSLTMPDEWTDLIVIPLARVLAVRDARPNEVAALDAEYNSLVGAFIDHVSVYDHSATRPLIAVPAATGTKPPAGAPVQPGAPRVMG